MPVSYAQSDSTGLKVTADTITNQSVTKDTLAYHSPKKASLLSAALPGLGQAYNKKYWKIPVIYAGLFGLGYAVGFYHSNYVIYRDAYIAKTDTNSLTIDHYPEIDAAVLLENNDYYRKNRDIFIIAAVGMYVINIIDASVDAHLFTFDVSDDLSINVNPVFYSSFQSKENYAGISLRIKL